MLGIRLRIGSSVGPSSPAVDGENKLGSHAMEVDDLIGAAGPRILLLLLPPVGIRDIAESPQTSSSVKMALLGLFKRRHHQNQNDGSTETISQDPAEMSSPTKPELAGTVFPDGKKVQAQSETVAIEAESHENPEIIALSLQVRQLISLTDDPTLPTITFRYLVLSALFVIPGAFLVPYELFPYH